MAQEKPPEAAQNADRRARYKLRGGIKESVARQTSAAWTWAYQRAVVDFILRRKRVEASTDGRHVPLTIEPDEPLFDARRGHSYISNNIRTSRYTVWDFVPKQLFFQFSRLGNFYFLSVGIPQMIPGLSTTGSYTTILPLLVFVMFTIAKEGYDDYRRYRLDEVENANFATVLGREDKYSGKDLSIHPIHRWNPFYIKREARPRKMPEGEFQSVRWVPVRWSNIKVGDVITLARDEPVPADIVLLHSDGEDSLAYIETMALDGETNLKSKQVSPALKNCDTIEGISRCNAQFVLEDPNPELFRFDGRVTVDEKTVPLTLNEVIYRGSILRNTNCVKGIVVNTGEECKIRMNSNRHPKAKKPALEKVVNVIVLTLVVYLIALSVGLSFGYVRWQKDFERHAWFLHDAKVPFHEIIIAFIIMFNNVIPLSLYVSLEIVKVGQLLMLNSDLEMYDEETDTPARCNTNTILENLGQVGYIFSDKTGTLTDNVMKFRKISVAGTIWLHEKDLENSALSSADALKEDDSTSSDDITPYKKESLFVTVADDDTPPTPLEVPISPLRPSIGTRPSLGARPSIRTRPSMGRRSSSHWRSTGRPDHVQPEVNTTDMLEYIRLRPNSVFSRKAKDYLLAMALCHTCLPEVKDGRVEFQASSPDELALVTAAQELGYGVVHRTSQTLTLQMSGPDGDGPKLVFEILDVIEFSSARKRMSVVVRYPDGRIAIICKGADSAILPRLKESTLAMQKANEVRKSADLERQMLRRSEQLEPRNSFGGRPSLTIRRSPAVSRDSSLSRRPIAARSKSFEVRKLARKSGEHQRLSLATRGVSFDLSKSPRYLNTPVQYQQPVPAGLDFLDEARVDDDSEVFTRCFKHLDDFATEGLRTLVYAQKFVPEDDYAEWKKHYDEATTSLVDRQERIEAAAEMIEQSFSLVGATAIEDKLQKGVPETIDRLRRANINIWMLTGDKRETAINIAHSARICRPGSDLYILDAAAKESLQSQLVALAEDIKTAIHSVVVIDGHTLGIVEKSDDLAQQFFSVMILVDSVICCRASPAQKSLLVRTVRARLRKFRGRKRRGLTLAIGDGSNDLAMIQSSHVGIGISGKEGLQAARVADYSIAQFRFLQRLLLVHGRWNYIRTAKFIIATFWKELFFYLPQAEYQPSVGYSGTSLFEATSLTVYNTLFTSLCCICMGIWEQDLSADTLLAVPELYVFGQRNMGLNSWKYFRWMLLAAIEGIVSWWGCWAGYAWVSPLVRDEGLYGFGQLLFTVGVLWINWKLFIFETHYKTAVVMGSFFVTTGGWFAWNAFLDGAYAPSPSGPYAISDSFVHRWGADAVWWATVFIVLALIGLMEFLIKIAKRNLLLWGLYSRTPWRRRRLDESNLEEWDVELWQELEQEPAMRERLRVLARGEEEEADVTDDVSST